MAAAPDGSTEEVLLRDAREEEEEEEEGEGVGEEEDWVAVQNQKKKRGTRGEVKVGVVPSIVGWD